MSFRRFLFVAAGVALSTTALASRYIPYTGSLRSIDLGQSEEGGIAGPGNQSIDFEAPAYTTGVLEPQNGWLASGVNLPWNSVSTANPAGGAQHARVIFDTTVAAGTTRNLLGPNLGDQPDGGNSLTNVKVANSNDQGASVSVLGQAPTQGFLTWRVLFNLNDGFTAGTPGAIFVLDDPDLGGALPLAFYATGVTWNEGPYTDLRVSVRQDVGAIDYYYGGVLIYTSTIYAGTETQQFVVSSNNRQLTDETFDVDDIEIVPEPGTALLGLLGLAMLRRR